MGACHPKEGGEWRSPLKRGHPEEGDRPAVVDAGVRLRYTEGGLRAEERRGRGVQSGGTASGGRRFGGFGAKLSPTWESGKLRRLLRKGLRWMGSWAGNARGHAGFDGLGLKTITALFGSAEAWIR